MSTIEVNKELRNKLFESFDNFLIIGAFDGLSHDDVVVQINEKTDNSNTKVIFVEPIPEYFGRLKSNLQCLKIPENNIFLENSCIGNEVNEVEMAYFNPNSEGNKPWYIEGCACVVENGIPLNIYIRHEIPEQDLLHIKTQQITVKNVLDKYNFEGIDYLQIDTEGYDQRIIESIDLNELGVKYLKFEIYYCEPEFIEKLRERADSMGFYYFEDWDFHLIRKDLI